MRFEDSKKTQCPACYSSEKAIFGEKNGFDIFLCRSCSTCYSSKRSSTPDFDYNDYYHEGNLEVPDFVTLRLREIIQTFEQYRKNNLFLDVGCGAGSLVKAATSENWKAEGVEVSQSSVKYLRKQNIKVFNGDLISANFAENQFDVVTAVEILEHIPNSEILLKEIYRILRPGGLLWATTPHGNGASSKFLGTKWSCIAPPEHLQLFSVKGIRKLLIAAGFRNTSILTQGVNPFEIFHILRKGSKAVNQDVKNTQCDGMVFSRVDTAYELNEALSKSPVRRAVKNLLNSLLNVSRMGDSLKIRAEK